MASKSSFSLTKHSLERNWYQKFTKKKSKISRIVSWDKAGWMNERMADHCQGLGPISCQMSVRPYCPNPSFSPPTPGQWPQPRKILGLPEKRPKKGGQVFGTRRMTKLQDTRTTKKGAFKRRKGTQPSHFVRSTVKYTLESLDYWASKTQYIPPFGSASLQYQKQWYNYALFPPICEGYMSNIHDI